MLLDIKPILDFLLLQPEKRGDNLVGVNLESILAISSSRPGPQASGEESLNCHLTITRHVDVEKKFSLTAHILYVLVARSTFKGTLKESYL